MVLAVALKTSSCRSGYLTLVADGCFLDFCSVHGNSKGHTDSIVIEGAKVSVRAIETFNRTWLFGNKKPLTSKMM